MSKENQSEKKEKQLKRGGVRTKVSSKSTKRSSLKYKALHPEVNLKSRYNEIKDLSSYKQKLNEDELDWLDRFSHEYVCGNFNHGGEVLHNTDELRKKCYGNNNRRNRDIVSQEEAKGILRSTDYMASHWYGLEVLNEALKTNIFDRIKKRKGGSKDEEDTDEYIFDNKY